MHAIRLRQARPPLAHAIAQTLAVYMDTYAKGGRNLTEAELATLVAEEMRDARREAIVLYDKGKLSCTTYNIVRCG